MSSSSTSRRKKWYSPRRRRSDRSESDERVVGRQPKPRRWRWLVLLLVVSAAVVWFLPTLVAHSPMLNWIIARAAADLDGTVVTGSASLGWFSPVGVSDIEVRDARGESVLSVPRASGDTSLLAVLANRSELGTFRLDKPTLQIVLTSDGSNVETLLGNYLTGPSGEPLGVGLEIVDGTVLLRDADSSKSCTIEQLQLALRMSAKDNQPISLTAKGVIADDTAPGRFDVEMTKDTAGQLVLKTESLPLEKLDGLLVRFLGNIALGGRLTSNVECQWGGAATDALHLRADAEVDALRLALPQLADRIDLEKLKGGFEAASTSGKWMVRRVDLDCDLGKLSLGGDFVYDPDAPGGVLDAVMHQAYQAQGRINLARLALMMPKTLRIHEETRVTSGELQMDLASQRGAQGMLWKAKLRTSDLTAMRRGKELVWQQPIVLAFDAHEDDGGPRIDSLTCESHFLTVRAAGWREDLAASLQFDLDRLVQRLDGFVDLSGTRMQGNGWANLNWRRDRQNAFTLDADAQIRGFQLALANRSAWQEDSLVVLLSSTGQTTFGPDTRIDTADLEIKAGDERLHARLTQPIADISQTTAWPLSINATGQLQRSVARARAFDYLKDWHVAGAYQFRAEGVAAASGVELRDARLDIDQLEMVGAGLNVAEPAASLSLAGQYLHAERRILLKQAELTMTTLGVQASELIVGLPEGQPTELAGTLNYRGDLARLQQWISKPNTPPAWRASGQLAGQARLRQVGLLTSGQIETRVSNLTLASAAGKQFAEPAIQLAAVGAYDHQTRLLKLEQCKFTSDALGGEINGQVADVTGRRDAQLAGQLAYDLEKVSTLLRPYVGGGVYLAGRGTRPLDAQGPLNTAEATGSAAVDWSGAYVYGFRIGPGQLAMRLAGGVLQIDPLDLPVNEGRLHLVSRLKLAPGPMELQIDPGPLVQQVRIDPDMCAYALQYIAPVLAGVATAQGKFSIDLDGCRIPIDDPAQGEIAGRFTVHSVEIGAGPLVRELTILLARESSAKLTRESVIPFRMVNGRVYHENLELVFPELTIRTRGSVGLDQSLAIVAEMPVPPKWLAANTTLTSALRDQTITLPVSGTLSRPQIDRQKLDQYNQQFLRKATENVIQNELNRQFDRLFKPR